MEQTEAHVTVILCTSCGLLARHYPFVKPLCLEEGLVCSRCGHLLRPETGMTGPPALAIANER